MATVTVLYPQGTKFDMEYYKATHMPLVEKNWSPHGLKSWKVIQLPDDSPYLVQAVLEWGSMSDFQAAQGIAETKEVMGDIPNFSDKQPTIIAGTHVISSK